MLWGFDSLLPRHWDFHGYPALKYTIVALFGFVLVLMLIRAIFNVGNSKDNKTEEPHIVGWIGWFADNYPGLFASILFLAFYALGIYLLGN